MERPSFIRYGQAHRQVARFSPLRQHSNELWDAHPRSECPCECLTFATISTPCTAQPFYIIGNVLSLRAIAKNPPVHAGDGIAMN